MPFYHWRLAWLRGNSLVCVSHQFLMIVNKNPGSCSWFRFSSRVIGSLCSFSSQVPDDPADSICAPSSPQTSALHLWLKGEIPPAPGFAHSGLPRAWDQEAAGGAGDIPSGKCGHSQLRLCLAVRHTHQPGTRGLEMVGRERVCDEAPHSR